MIKWVNSGILTALLLIFTGCSGQKSSPSIKLGKKTWINESVYIIPNFDKRPAIGMLILKIEAYGKDGSFIRDYSVEGKSGMPSMGSAHDSGVMLFKQNSKGAYLFPLNIVMPGEWQIDFSIKKDGNDVYSDKIVFSVK